MSNMFTNYENLSSTYVPDNTTNRCDKFIYFENNKIKKEYDMNGNFIGYSWAYGDTVSLDLSLSKKIRVEEDAIIYNELDEKPTSSTFGKKGQRAYNIIDIKSWTCESLDQSTYSWIEDEVFKYPKNGTKEIFLQTLSDLSFKETLFTIKNFREEVIHSQTMVAENPLVINIDKELSSKLLEGIYSCYLTIFNVTSSSVCLKFNIIIKDANSFYNSSASIVGD